MAKTVRMADIAEKLGVSIVTVSKALNGKDGVSSTLRSEILKKAKEMGYESIQPSASTNDSYIIGILNSYLYLEKGASFYWSLYEKLLKHLTLTDNIGVLEVITQNAQIELSIPKLVTGKKVDGLIAMGPFPDDYIQMLSKLDIPLVMLDSYSAKFNLDTVISDGYYGTYFMTNYLINQGHRKIAFLGTIGQTSSITDRFYGYCNAMREANIKVTDDMIIPDRNDVGRIKLNLPLDINKKFTAFVCNCDYTAYEAMNYLRNINISVPEDISIVGFDNYILSEVNPVKITTYAVNQERMAKESVRQICERIQDPYKKREMNVVNGEILFRDSVKKINP